MEPRGAVARLLEWTSHKCEDALTRPARMAAMLECIAPDHRRLRVIKIAGTNGKGATAVMLATCLTKTGRRVGLFTSPHLVSPSERMRIDGVMIASDELDRRAAKVESVLLELARTRGPGFIPYFFEAMLVIALQWFLDRGVDDAVIEAGIGGGRDATSVLPGGVSALTTVSLDHERLLGSTVESIAADKAAIATRGTVLVVGPGVGADAFRAIDAVSRDRDVRLTRAGMQGVDVIETSCTATHIVVHIEGRPVRACIHLGGVRQIDNFATVLAVLRELAKDVPMSLADAVTGVAEARWPGRFEYAVGPPDWLLDGAHNPEALAALADGVERSFAKRRRVLVIGAATDKRIDAWAPQLSRIADEAFITDDFHRAAPGRDVAAALEGVITCHYRRMPLAWLNVEIDRPDALRVVTGSFFLVGRMLEMLHLRSA